MIRGNKVPAGSLQSAPNRQRLEYKRHEVSQWSMQFFFFEWRRVRRDLQQSPVTGNFRNPRQQQQHLLHVSLCISFFVLPDRTEVNGSGLDDRLQKRPHIRIARSDNLNKAVCASCSERCHNFSEMQMYNDMSDEYSRNVCHFFLLLRLRSICIP